MAKRVKAAGKNGRKNKHKINNVCVCNITVEKSHLYLVEHTDTKDERSGNQTSYE